jgi:hypothetical protein
VVECERTCVQSPAPQKKKKNLIHWFSSKLKGYDHQKILVRLNRALHGSKYLQYMHKTKNKHPEYINQQQRKANKMPKYLKHLQKKRLKK